VKNSKSFLKYAAILALTLVLGAAIGAAYANSLDYAAKLSAGKFLDAYYETAAPPKKELFLDSFFKYGKTLAIIWITIFIPLGFIPAAGVIFYKGASSGFTTAFFAAHYGREGLRLAFSTFFLQNLFLIPAYFTAALYVFLRAFDRWIKKVSPATGAVYATERSVSEYLTAAAAGIFLTAIAAFADVLLIR
jgi:uncharacterized membrane protein SpoIIM required for sporulation